MKKKTKIVLAVILLIIPIVVACVNYATTNDRVKEITLTDPDGTVYTFKRTGATLDMNNISTNMLEFFDRMNGTSVEEQLPSSLEGAEYYTAVFDKYASEEEYKYYFNTDPDACYFTNGNGKTYRMGKDYAEMFLNSVYGRSAFVDADLPFMTTPAGEVIEHTEISWYYEGIGGVWPCYAEQNSEAYTDTVYVIPEQFNLAFSKPISEASEITIVTSDGKEIAKDKLYEDVGILDIPANKELEVTLKAKWFNTNEDATSTATYKFKCIIADKAVFYIGYNSDTLYSGDFVTIVAKNIICDTSEIGFTSDLGVTPTFYNTGNEVLGLLPIPLETETGTYTITLSADGTEQSVDLSIEKKNRGTKEESIDSSVTLSDELRAQYDEDMADIYSAITDKQFGGEWLYPTYGEVTSGYGRTCVTTTGYEYMNKWVRLTASEGDTVTAMNQGTVVYVGSHTMTGTTVVVDHGLGLMSTYANLDSAEVSVGQELEKGERIGSTGSTGYSEGDTFSFALTIGGTYVCPYEILDEEGVSFRQDTN